jgi:SAM-dependent methyltransferase
MEAAHSVVASVVGQSPGAVLDLGCGDGALLARLTLDGFGIEQDAGVVERGARRHPGLSLFVGRIEKLHGTVGTVEPDVVLVMPGRLLEMSQEDADLVRAGLLRKKRVVVYAYGDWLARFGGLSELAAKAGFPALGRVRVGQGVAAAEVILG